MRHKYLVISPNGYGNAGDDLCAYCGRFAITQTDRDAEIRIGRPPMRRSVVDWADVVVLSGGGILYDRELKNVDNYMRYVDYAVSRGKRAAVLGAGVQGIVTEDGRRRYRESLARCAFVSVRTAEDKRALDAIGFNRATATLDIAFFARAMLRELDGAPGAMRRRRHACATRCSPLSAQRSD
jgi:polysaccharide pyruvyl transferase WcaK-like protein